MSGFAPVDLSDVEWWHILRACLQLNVVFWVPWTVGLTFEALLAQWGWRWLLLSMYLWDNYIQPVIDQASGPG